MKVSEIDQLEGFFTAREIENTGADLKDVKLELMLAIVEVRKRLNRRVRPLKNGLTTGKHSSVEHPNGTAIDFFLDDRDGPVNQEVLYLLIRAAIDAGFRGVGFYYNGKVWSFHLDLRDELTIWTGRKKAPGKGSWVFKRMLIGSQVR